jgi:predicted adenine nucleotide alpha hydrolase (AANH) superfamily ATPase
MSAGSILVHACCGPCAITVFQTLAAWGTDFQGFYYNPNIHPLTEYLRRKDALVQVAERLGVRVTFADSEYDPSLFLRLAAFREKDRCRSCYGLRLDRAARQAMSQGCSGFTTTLLYSKYQDHEAIREVGEEAARVHGVEFVYEDFRPGWEEGIRLAKQWELYRQPYCGCIFSEFDRYRKRLGQ